MTFFVERQDKGKWAILMAAEHPVDVGSIKGRNGEFPPAESPGNLTAFAGARRGHQARVRFNDQVMATYEWDIVNENPTDENSNRMWGWKLVERFPVDIKPAQMAGPLSFMG